MSEREEQKERAMQETSANLLDGLLEKAMSITRRERDPLVLDSEQEDRVLEYARRAVMAGIVPVRKADTHEIAVNKAFCAMMFGIELGLTRQQALSNVAVVDQRPSLMAKIKLGLCLKRGQFDERPWKEEVNFDKLGTPDWATVEAIWRCRRAGKEFVGRFSMLDAQRAGLLSKGADSNWARYPKDMLSHRAMDRCLDAACADILMGAETTEVMESSPGFQDEKPEPLPAPMQKKKKKGDEPPWDASTFPNTSTEKNPPPAEGAKKESSSKKATGAQRMEVTKETVGPPIQMGFLEDEEEMTAKDYRQKMQQEKPFHSVSKETSLPSSGGSLPSTTSSLPAAGASASAASSSGLPSPKSTRPTEEEVLGEQAKVNEKDWKIWETLSPHLSSAAFADVVQRVKGRVHPTMEPHLLKQAIARAKYHLGPSAMGLLKKFENSQETS